MKIINIKKLPFEDFNVTNIMSIDQMWSSKLRFDYIDVARPDHGFLLVTSGRVTYTDIGGRVTEATKGSIVYLPKGKRYSAVFVSNGKKASSVVINFLLTDSQGNEFCLSDNIEKLCVNLDSSIIKEFLAVSGVYKTSTDRLHTKSAFLQLLLRVAAFENDDSLCDINNCIDYIDKSFASRISVNQLAKMCSMSETTFRNRFKEHFGRSPTEYINEKRLIAACELLEDSAMNVSEISELLGFYDTSYFCKMMKQYAGVTPIEYRMQAKKESNS